MPPTRREYSGAAAATSLTTGITADAMTFVVTDASGYPTGATGPFAVVIDRGSVSEEKVLVTSRTGTTFTVATRGWDGTTASAHAAGASVEHCWTAIDADEANATAVATIGTVSAKGDLLVAPSAGQLSRLAVGANNRVLMADSAEPLGVRWAAQSAITHGNLSGLTADDHPQYTQKGTLTTKGDIYAAQASATPVRVPVGSNDEVLTADSAASAGVRWGRIGPGSLAADSVTTTAWAANAVTAAKIDPAVAGNGLTGGGGSALAVNPDGTTVEVVSDQVRVKDGGITQAKLASGYRATFTGLSAPSGAVEGDLWVQSAQDRVYVHDGTVSQRIGHYASGGRTGGIWTRSTNLSVPELTKTKLVFTGETADSDNFLTPTSGDITVPAGLGGWYAYDVRVTWASSPGINSIMYTDVGATTVHSSAGANITGWGWSGMLLLDAGNVVSFYVLQAAGFGALTISACSVRFHRVMI